MLRTLLQSLRISPTNDEKSSLSGPSKDGIVSFSFPFGISSCRKISEVHNQPKKKRNLNLSHHCDRAMHVRCSPLPTSRTVSEPTQRSFAAPCANSFLSDFCIVFCPYHVVVVDDVEIMWILTPSCLDGIKVCTKQYGERKDDP